MAKQTVKQRKALRSEAAKKGWQTRRQARFKNFAIELDRRMVARLLDDHGVTDWIAPKPSLWQRIKGWFA